MLLELVLLQLAILWLLVFLVLYGVRPLLKTSQEMLPSQWGS